MRTNYTKSWSAVALLLLCGATTGFAQNFLTPLYIPPLLDQPVYNLTMDRETHNFDSAAVAGPQSLNRTINTFAYNHLGSNGNSYLGPTMIWRHGRPVTLNITNNLQNTTPTSSAEYTAPTTTHLHGAHVAAWVDGGPHGVIEPGTTRSVTFDVLDDPCTLWYHPHGQDETYTQVEMGLAGMIIVQDPADLVANQLPHQYGIDDIPLILQDHIFDTIPGMIPWQYAGNIDTNRTQKGPRVVVINGINNPIISVPPQLVKFRVLDGSSRLAFNFGIGTISSGNVVTRLPFQIIGSDGGYLSDGPITVDSILTGPGIRNEIVFDFTGYAGQDLYLLNLNQTSNSLGIITANKEGYTQLAFAKISVGQAPINPAGALPAFPHLTPYDVGQADTTRTKLLTGTGAPSPVLFTIDHNQYEFDTVNDIVRENAIEIWTIKNYSGIAHPFHIHDIQFYVTEVFDSNTTTHQLVPQPIPAEFQGKKDDILIQPNQVVSFVTKFEDFGRPGPFTPSTLDSAAYMYHCHILTHEDGYYTPNGQPHPTASQRDHYGMMQQFVVWNGLMTGTQQQVLTDDMVLYPNPATNVLHLRGESTKPSTVTVFDLSGRKLLVQDLAPFDGTIDISTYGLAKGMILVEWASTKGKFTKKVVIR